MSKEEKTIYLEWFQAIDEFIKDGKFAKLPMQVMKSWVA